MNRLSFYAAAYICAAIWGTGAVTAHASDAADAIAARSKGSSIYVPVYSSIRYFNDKQIDLSVKISIRNTDPEIPITILSADYFDNHGVSVRRFVEAPVVLPGFGTHELFIKQTELRGDTGANLAVKWSSDRPAAPPLIESVMIGTMGVSNFAFTSRGVTIPP